MYKCDVCDYEYAKYNFEYPDGKRVQVCNKHLHYLENFVSNSKYWKTYLEDKDSINKITK